MTNQYGISTGIGLRHVRVAIRDTDGTIKLPAGTAKVTAYEGEQIQGALDLSLTLPDPQRVTARGDDQAYYTFNLPPTDNPTAELRVSKTQTEIVAKLTGTHEFGSPPIKKIGFGTDKQGLEPAVILWGYRQAIDSEEGSIYFGQQIWQTYILLNALCALRPSPMTDATVSEFVYSVVANDASVDEFGTLFTEGVHGFTLCPYIMAITKYKLTMDAFTGNGATLIYTLSRTASDVGKDPIVAVDGVIQHQGVVPGDDYVWSANKVVFNVGHAPADLSKVIVEYEYA